jgi:hypothetical protein
MNFDCFLSSFLKDHEILNSLRERKLFEFKKTLQQIHFIAIVMKFLAKIISNAFEILLLTQLFHYLDMKFNFSHNPNKQHTRVVHGCK